MGMLDGKVVVVTGGGRGVGRGIALMAAQEGARIVVNDLGGSPAGGETAENPAEDVVAEITRDGGAAAASQDSVASWASAQRIVQCAMDSFGRIDAVINNAGILRDSIFHKMAPEDFDAVLDVNLRGPFYVSRAAAPHFKAAGAGVFLHMTSTSALIGNLGQANYAASKMGLVGLSTAISLDMARFGVASNCIAPFAWTRMVGTIPADTPEQRTRLEGLQRMLPERIAPFAVALMSEVGRTHVNGQIFGVRNNEIYLFGKTRPIQIMHTQDGWTPDSVIERALPAFAPNFLPPVRSGDVFCWPPT